MNLKTTLLTQKTKKIYLVFTWLLTCIIAFQYVLFLINNYDSQFFIKLLEVELLLIFIFSFCISVKTSGFTSIYSLFLSLCFVFNYSRIFLDLLSDFEIKYSDLFSRIILTNNTQIILLFLMIFFLLAGTISFCIYYKKTSFSIPTNLKYVNTGKKLIKFLMLPLLLVYVKQLYFILTNGYISLFNGDLLRNTSVIEIILPRLMEYSFYIFLAGVPTEKQFKKYSLIYILLMLFHALKGQRGSFMLLLILVLWYYYKVYNKKLKFNRLISISIPPLLLSQLLIFTRVNKDLSNYSFLDVPYNFILQNGISVNVSAYVIQFYDSGMKSVGVPYFFAPLHDYFYRLFIDRSVFYEGRTDKLLEVSNYLSNQLIYFINADAYYFGNGTGSSYLAELFDLGGVIGGAIILFFLTKFILQFEFKSNYNRFFLFLSPIVLMKFVYIPRDSFLKIIDDLGLVIIIYFLVRYLLINKSKTSS
jgi:hypothetical protein